MKIFIISVVYFILLSSNISYAFDKSNFLIGRLDTKDRYVFDSDESISNCQETSDMRNIISEYYYEKDKNISKNKPAGDKSIFFTDNIINPIEIKLETPVIIKKMEDVEWVFDNKTDCKYKLKAFYERSDGAGPCWVFGSDNRDIYTSMQYEKSKKHLVIARSSSSMNFNLIHPKNKPISNNVFLRSEETWCEDMKFTSRLVNLLKNVYTLTQVTCKKREVNPDTVSMFVDLLKIKELNQELQKDFGDIDKENVVLTDMHIINSSINGKNQVFVFASVNQFKETKHWSPSFIVNLSANKLCLYNNEDYFAQINFLGLLTNKSLKNDLWVIENNYWEGYSRSIVEPKMTNGVCQLNYLMQTAYRGL